ncbi:MAG: metallophosphoesterase family protein [Pseudomonadales bacterium]
MIRRLGIIGDLHGEHERLETALDWFAGRKLDALVCTGDVADGRGCINRSCALLRDAGVVTVAGNHDRWLLDDRVRHVEGAHHLSDLDDEALAFLQALPATQSIATVAGSLLLCHGVGDNDMAKVWPGTTRSRIERSHKLDDLLGSGAHRFLVNGHMHFRVLIDFAQLLLINAGTLKGDHAGISIVDFESGSVSAYDVSDGRTPTRVAEHSLAPAPGRRVWRDTQEFDGDWQPVMLYA